MGSRGNHHLIALLLLVLGVGASPVHAIPDGCLHTPGLTVAIDGLECTLPLEAGRTEWEMKVHEGFQADASFRIILADGTLVALTSCSGRDELLGEVTTFRCGKGYFLPPYHIRTGAGFWRDGLQMWGIVDLPADGGTLVVSGHGTGPMTASTT